MATYNIQNQNISDHMYISIRINIHTYLPRERALLLGEEDLDCDVVPAPLAAPHLPVAATPDRPQALGCNSIDILNLGRKIETTSVL